MSDINRERLIGFAIGLFLALVLTLLVGCEAGNRDTTDKWKLPPELDGYKVYELSNTGGTSFYVLVPVIDKTKPTLTVTTGPKGATVGITIINGKKYNIVEAEE